MRDGPIGPGPVRCTALASGVPKAFKSAPAQKVPPSPHNTATDAESSRSNRSNAAYSAAAVGPLTALRAAGRLMITVVTGPLRSTRTDHSCRLRSWAHHVVPPGLVRVAPPVRWRSRGRPRASRAPGQSAGSSSSGSIGSVSRWRTIAAATTNRPGMSVAQAISSSKPVPGLRPSRADPTAVRPTRPGRRRVPCSTRTRAATSAANSRSRLSGRIHTPSRSSPKRLSCIVFRSAARVRASVPTLVTTTTCQAPCQARVRGSHGVVLATLAGQQPIREPVAVGGAHQVTGTDHAGQRDPQRRFLDAEIGCQPDQFAGGGPGGVGAEQHAQHHRPGGHAGQRSAWVLHLKRRCSPAVVAERLVAVP